MPVLVDFSVAFRCKNGCRRSSSIFSSLGLETIRRLARGRKGRDPIGLMYDDQSIKLKKKIKSNQGVVYESSTETPICHIGHIETKTV